MVALFFQGTFGADEEMPVRLEREREHADVGQEKHDGDAQRKLTLDGRTPTRRARVRGEVKHRRDNESDGCEGKRDHGRARPGLVEALFLVLCPTQQDGETKHEQNVADDRPGDRGLDHTDMAFVKRDAGND